MEQIKDKDKDLKDKDPKGNDSSKTVDKKDKRRRTRKPHNNDSGKPAPSYGHQSGDKVPNPGDGQVFTGGQGRTGEIEGAPAAEMDARDAYRQDPSWAQTNPSEYANAFQPTFSNYDQVITGGKFPWYLSEWKGFNMIGSDTISVSIEDDSPANKPYQFMEIDITLTTGECWHPEEYGAEYQPYVYIGKLLYQSISARKRNALPVDALSISAYLMAFQSIIALRAYIKLILKLCSIVENSEKNVAKRNARMLRPFFNTQLDMEMAIGIAGASNTNDYWMNAVGALNSVDGMMNQCMSPPELPIYKRADYLFSHVIAEYNDDDMSNFYLMKLRNVYRINWVGDENGTYLESVYVSSHSSLSQLIGLYRSLVDAFTGHAWGADDPNHIQAGLKYVFANKIKFNEWESTTYTSAEGKEITAPARATWNDVLASGIDCHLWLHNMKMLNSRFVPGDIAYDPAYYGLHQHWYVDSQATAVDMCKEITPTAWDFEFGSPSADDLYECSTLTTLYKVHSPSSRDENSIFFKSKNDDAYIKDLEKTLTRIAELKSNIKHGVDKWSGSSEDRKANANLLAELRDLRAAIEAPFDLSMGTEICSGIYVTRVNADYTIDRVHCPQSLRLLNDTPSNVLLAYEAIAASAKFAHRPLQYLTYSNSELTANVRRIVGVNYDTYALCPIRENDIDRMHFTATKSYFGISNKDTLSWITPTTAYSDLDKS